MPGLRRLPAAGRREAAIERLVLGGHLGEELGGPEARTVLLLQRLAQLDEALGAHHVDVAQGPAGEGREAEAEDGADVALAYVGEHALLEDARALERLD